jgi:hypothetical protein
MEYGHPDRFVTEVLSEEKERWISVVLNTLSLTICLHVFFISTVPNIEEEIFIFWLSQ